MTIPIENARFEAILKLATERYGAVSAAERVVLQRSVAFDFGPGGADHRPMVRAPFVRWLVTDSDAVQHIDPHGYRVENATISSTLDLDSCKAQRPLRFDHVTLKAELSLRDAQLPALSISDSVLEKSILADGLKVAGDVSLLRCRTKSELVFIGCETGGDFDCDDVGFEIDKSSLSLDRARIRGGVFFRDSRSEGTIRLVGAAIDGDVDFTGSTFEVGPEKPAALLGDGMKVSGTVFLQAKFDNDKKVTRKFECNSDVEIDNAQIGGNLDCDGANFLGNVSADNARISGSVKLTLGFSSGADVSFIGAQIGGELNCTGAQFKTVDFELLRLAGPLKWIGIRHPETAKLSLGGATVGSLHDDKGSWPVKDNLEILDFVYQDLVLHPVPTSDQLELREAIPTEPRHTLESRVDWLMRQSDGQLEYAQPWVQLSKLLQNDGDDDGAKRVMYAYHRQKAGAAGRFMAAVSGPYDLLQEQPLWILAPIAALGMVGSLLYWRAHRMRAMVPTEKSARQQYLDSGSLPAGHPPFNPVVYSLENVLPVVKLGQDSSWAPNHLVRGLDWLPERPAWVRKGAGRTRFTRWLFRMDYHRLALFRWALILLGWASALILATAIGARFKP